MTDGLLDYLSFLFPSLQKGNYYSRAYLRSYIGIMEKTMATTSDLARHGTISPSKVLLLLRPRS